MSDTKPGYSEEFIERANQMWDHCVQNELGPLDTNRDGKIDKNDDTSALGGKWNVDLATLKNRLKNVFYNFAVKYDRDGDGAFNDEEYNRFDQAILRAQSRNKEVYLNDVMDNDRIIADYKWKLGLDQPVAQNLPRISGKTGSLEV